MERRIDLRDDHRQQLARVRLVRDAAGERDQDLARVVLGPEELPIEPALRGVAVFQDDAEHGQEEEIEQRPPADDHRERHVALPHQRAEQRHDRERHQERQRSPRECVLQAAAQDRARAEHPPHRHRVGQAERRQQDDRLQHRFNRPRQYDRHAEQVEHQRQAGLERIREHRGDAGEDHDLNAPPLVGIEVDAVAADAFDDDQHVGGERDGERRLARPAVRRQPRQRRQRRIRPEQEHRRDHADDQERQRRRNHRGDDPLVPVENLCAVREVEDGEADDRERERGDQPVEDQQHGADDRQHPFRAEQRAAVGCSRCEERQRHQGRRRATRAQ